MRFFVRKRRPTPAVIIVALIDVLIVILIFLMVTSTFRQQQHTLRLALPESTQAQKAGASETPPLLVTIDANGNKRVGADALPVTDQRLREELRAGLAKNPQLKVTLSADKDAPFGEIVKVMDAAKEAGIRTVESFVKEAGE